MAKLAKHVSTLQKKCLSDRQTASKTFSSHLSDVWIVRAVSSNHCFPKLLIHHGSPLLKPLARCVEVRKHAGFVLLLLTQLLLSLLMTEVQHKCNCIWGKTGRKCTLHLYNSSCPALYCDGWFRVQPFVKSINTFAFRLYLTTTVSYKLVLFKQTQPFGAQLVIVGHTILDSNLIYDLCISSVYVFPSLLASIRYPYQIKEIHTKRICEILHNNKSLNAYLILVSCLFSWLDQKNLRLSLLLTKATVPWEAQLKSGRQEDYTQAL